MSIDVKQLLTLALMVGIIEGFGAGLALADSDEAPSSNAHSMQMDTTPGPAFTTVDGKISKIDGPVYTVQSESTGYQNLGTTKNVNEVKIYVGKETKILHGEKRVGDKIRAEVTQGGFANSIQ